jgi:hypothetical protein
VHPKKQHEHWYKMPQSANPYASQFNRIITWKHADQKSGLKEATHSRTL